MMPLILLFVLCGLSSCSLSTAPKPAVTQQNLLTKCPVLPDLTGVQGKDVLNTMTTWGVMYEQCAARQNSRSQDDTP